MFGVVVGALAIVCVCACNQWAWMIFRLKNAKMPIYLEINIHVLYAVVFGMLHIFMCQSSISRTSFKYSAEESKWRSGRSNRKIVNILCGSFLWAPNWRFFPILYTFLIKNHWLFYTSEKLIFNNICSQYIKLATLDILNAYQCLVFGDCCCCVVQLTCEWFLCGKIR